MCFIFSIGTKKAERVGFFYIKILATYFLNFLLKLRPNKPKPRKAKPAGAGTGRLARPITMLSNSPAIPVLEITTRSNASANAKSMFT